ncbi:hypothetical protein ACIBO2_02355 [Nonomuraea sp. NPDC050022]|uniref:hypothetical protein n=1 Tax=Nonomuraea sp. NPDC050022 TaxID=3364358 RepID=UPI0037AFE34C
MWTTLIIFIELGCLLLVVVPKAPYWMQSAQYKNREPHEPAGWAVTFNRVAGIIGLVVFAFFFPAAFEHDQKPGTGQSTRQETEEKSEPSPFFTEQKKCDSTFPYDELPCKR